MELADKHGILIVDELIDKWSDKSYWGGRVPFTQLWYKMIPEWIKRDRNHPSVIMWSIGNELQLREDLAGFPTGDWGVTTYRIFDVLVKRYDSTRKTDVYKRQGIDFEMSRNFLVEDCSFDQGDDAVVIKAGRNQDAWRLNTPCENIVIRNCRILKGHTLLGIGSEISGGIRNIYMHDCTAPNSVMRLFFVKTNHRRGGFIENIYMKNVASGTAQRVLEIDTEVLYQWKDLVDVYKRQRFCLAG